MRPKRVRKEPGGLVGPEGEDVGEEEVETEVEEESDELGETTGRIPNTEL